jgi:hypothetical protein
VLDLFLARPFGGQSLVQRMFSTSLNEDIREIQEQIDLISEKIADPDYCEKVKQFVIAPLEIQQIFKADAGQWHPSPRCLHVHALTHSTASGYVPIESEGIDILAVILRSPDAPALGRPQMLRVIRAHRAYATYKKERDDLEDSDDDDGPEQEDGWLFIDLNHLMKLYSRLREKEKMVALIFEVSHLLDDSNNSSPIADGCLGLILAGSDGRVAQGHHHYLLHAPRPGVQGRQHRRLAGRSADVHQRPHQDLRPGRGA